MELTITNRYLVLPVRQDAEKKKLFFREGGQCVGEWDIALCEEQPDFFAFLDVAHLIGKTIQLEAVPACSYSVRQTNQIDLPGLYEEPLRPKIHFTVKNGWNNDPNGLVYHKGVWHLYCQYNPCSTRWDNMCWLHAESPDLFHWKETGTVLLPDETGTIFSGCGIEDTGRKTGLGGKDAPLLFYYTAAGGYSGWSKNVPCTQRLAWSEDGGRTLQKYPETIVEHIEGENRDPKVIFCEELDCFVMALYLQEDRYALLTSQDLLHWEKLQEIHLPGDDECPDFFPLNCEDERRWVLIGAHDRYVIGRFIEGHFHAEQESRPLGVGPVYYAAQSYSGAPDNRRVRIGWHRLSIPDARFSQQMGVPCEITLARHADGFALCQQPVKEIEALREKHTVWEQTIDKTETFPLEGGAQDLLITAPKEDTPFSLTLRGCMIGWDPTSGCWQANGLELPVVPGNPCLRIISDTASLELFAGDGSGCCVCAVEDFSAPATLRVETSAPLELKIEQYALRGIHEKEGA